MKAQAEELKTLKESIIPDLRKQLADMRVEFVRADTKATELEKQAVRDAALVELFSKLVRPKKFGIIVF